MDGVVVKEEVGCSNIGKRLLMVCIKAELLELYLLSATPIMQPESYFRLSKQLVTRGKCMNLARPLD